MAVGLYRRLPVDRGTRERAARLALRHGCRELEAIAPYGAPGRTLPIKDIYVERKWVSYYGGVMAYRRDNSADGDLAQLSPDYSDQEIGHIWDGNKFATPYLLPGVVALDLTKTHKLAVLLILFEGRHDRTVNSEVAAAWFDTVNAPEKQLIWFEHSGHMPMTEERGKFLLSLVRFSPGRSPRRPAISLLDPQSLPTTKRNAFAAGTSSD
jgi:proline iminopeptidase